jgi:hypothetical protein
MRRFDRRYHGHQPGSDDLRDDVILYDPSPDHWSTTTTVAITFDQIVGEGAGSSEHGSEFAVHADGGSTPMATSPTSCHQRHRNVRHEGGELNLVTDDCGEVVGSYSPRLFGAFLEFRSLGDSCTGREDGLTFGLYSRIDG